MPIASPVQDWKRMYRFRPSQSDQQVLQAGKPAESEGTQSESWSCSVQTIQGLKYIQCRGPSVTEALPAGAVEDFLDAGEAFLALQPCSYLGRPAGGGQLHHWPPGHPIRQDPAAHPAPQLWKTCMSDGAANLNLSAGAANPNLNLSAEAANLNLSAGAANPNLNLSAEAANLNLSDGAANPNLNLSAEAANLNLSAGAANLNLSAGAANLNLSAEAANLNLSAGAANLNLSAGAANLNLSAGAANLNLSDGSLACTHSYRSTPAVGTGHQTALCCCHGNLELLAIQQQRSGHSHWDGHVANHILAAGPHHLVDKTSHNL